MSAVQASPENPARAPRYLNVSGTRAPVDEELAESGFDYEQFATLAGPLIHPPADQPYRVGYRGIHHSKREWVLTRLIVLALVVLDVVFIYWLIFRSSYPDLSGWSWHGGMRGALADARILLLAGMAVGSIVMQLFLLTNVLTVSRACLAARDPIPVAPDISLRVAFLTTIVPGKEPIEMAERTLRAAQEIVYGGKLDVWLLDEGDSSEVKEMCGRLGVRHFSRKDRGYLDFDTGTFAARTKHGNHNRWLWEHAGYYDVVMFVDTDHVPLPIMAERLLGYFRDPNVAFVVAPQFYGNQESRITRWAESAQYLFHSVIQRAGNRRGCPMLVGTNAAVRTSAIRKGYVASITEDMATSLRIHATRNPATGRRWRSVYTPDLVAVGEGPASWTEFFGQQTRWSAGTFDAVLRQFWRVGLKLRPGAMMHYFMMLTYYPSVAVGWLLGITISACYLGFGISSLRTNEGWWITFYADIAALQFLLYRFMRRHNVSPHEPAGSSGLSGMLVSALTAPIYARSLLKVVFHRKLTFNVTAKGSAASQDRMWTFRYSLIWAIAAVAVLIVAETQQRPYAMMMAWTGVILSVCLAPIGIWLFDGARGGFRPRVAVTRRKKRHRGRHARPSGRSAKPNLAADKLCGKGQLPMTNSSAPRWPWARRSVRRLLSIMAGILAVGGVLAANMPTVGATLKNWYHQYQITRPAYEAKYGQWTQLYIPTKFRVNGIHATLLYNGDVLIMAGSGNNQAFFNAGSFKTLLLNPVTMQMRLIHTPWDLFCSGHIELPDGNILVAGGTSRYENLRPVYAAGSMTVMNYDTTQSFTLPEGTIFTAPGGAGFASVSALTVPRAVSRPAAMTGGSPVIVPGQQNVWVNALGKGNGSVIATSERYRVKGLIGPRSDSILFGIGTPMTLQKQNFHGSRDAYIFDVKTSRFVEVDTLRYARWYPTLAELGNGMVMAMSGLDGQGQVTLQNEMFNPQTRTWSQAPAHGFPTYPATFLTENGQLFFTGSNAGYGPVTPAWRTPGFWDIRTNTVRHVPGIKDPQDLETSASVLLPPAQKQTIMVMGGGGVGQSDEATARTALIDMAAPDPHWVAGPNLAEPTRYPITVLLPDDKVLVTGGSRYYRGMHGSDNRDTRIYNVATNSFSWAANSITGRDYHSGGILLPNGSVLTLGGNPLFGNAQDTLPQTFNQEIDVYYPPYFFAGTRPDILAAPRLMRLGHSYLIKVTQPADIRSFRLLRPDNPTHVTDVNQRSIAADFKMAGNGYLRMTLPSNPNLVPPSYYMLFAVNAKGIPSTGYWVRVS